MPDRLEDALSILSDMKGTPVAGGTNILIDIRSQKENPPRLVALGDIDELRGIKVEKGRVVVGSRTTISDLLKSSQLLKTSPSVIDAAGQFAGQMVRNTGTMGGNIACASPAADLVPPLMSLDAEVRLASASGSRTVALRDYYQGYKQDVRGADELVTQVSWNALPQKSVNRFYKLARRRGDAITVTGVAVTLSVSNGKCSKARIALGAVAPTAIRAEKAENMLEGQVLSETLIEAVATQAAAECSPIDDVRASADYRRHSVQMLTRRLISEAWNKLAQEVKSHVK
ncbi:MAG: hypothetical protein GY742_05665 [Hyphomicrobiales bacterium]|nr:hypothetical protein [Hyphomicrobiales bacterium]